MMVCSPHPATTIITNPELEGSLAANSKEDTLAAQCYTDAGELTVVKEWGRERWLGSGKEKIDKEKEKKRELIWLARKGGIDNRDW